MTIKKAKEQFEFMKKRILTDGIVDLDEADELLEFIDPYVQSNFKVFVELRQAIVKYSRSDGMTPDEATELVEKINIVSSALRTERIVEFIIFGGIAMFLLGWIIVNVVRIFAR